MKSEVFGDPPYPTVTMPRWPNTPKCRSQRPDVQSKSRLLLSSSFIGIKRTRHGLRSSRCRYNRVRSRSNQPWQCHDGRTRPNVVLYDALLGSGCGASASVSNRKPCRLLFNSKAPAQKVRVSCADLAKKTPWAQVSVSRFRKNWSKSKCV